MTYLNPAALTCPGYPGWTPGTPCTTGSGTGPYPNPIGRFGDARVGSIVGPGFVNLSSGLSKVFPVTERVHIRLEATFNDVLNHSNLGDPNMDISSPAFGQITSTIQCGSNNADHRVGMRRRPQRPGRGPHRLLNPTFPQPGKARTLGSALFFLGVPGCAPWESPYFRLLVSLILLATKLNRLVRPSVMPPSR